MNPVAGGAAEKAAVCKGDRLVWINGAMVSDLTHSALSKMVCGLFVTVFIDFGLRVMQQITHVQRKKHLWSNNNIFIFYCR